MPHSYSNAWETQVLKMLTSFVFILYSPDFHLIGVQSRSRKIPLFFAFVILSIESILSYKKEFYGYTSLLSELWKKF